MIYSDYQMHAKNQTYNVSLGQTCETPKVDRWSLLLPCLSDKKIVFAFLFFRDKLSMNRLLVTISFLMITDLNELS